MTATHIAAWVTIGLASAGFAAMVAAERGRMSPWWTPGLLTAASLSCLVAVFGWPHLRQVEAVAFYAAGAGLILLAGVVAVLPFVLDADPSPRQVRKWRREIHKDQP